MGDQRIGKDMMFRITPSPLDRWPVREYVATEEQLVRMAAAVQAVLDVLGGEIVEVGPCKREVEP
jgi:hypothetical protein